MARWKRIETSPKTIYAMAMWGDTTGSTEAPDMPAKDVWVLGTNQGLWTFEGDQCVAIAETLKEVAITAVATTPATMLVGARDGVAYSFDHGATWTQSSLSKPVQVTQLALTPQFDRTGMAYAVTLEDGLLRSMDRGRSWSSCNFGLLDLEGCCVALSPNFMNDTSMVFGVISGLFRSVNWGNAWREMNMDANAMPISAAVWADGLLLTGSESDGLHYSTDGGQSWGKRSMFTSGPISALAASPDGRRIAVGTPQVVAMSADQGQTWERGDGKMPRAPLSLAVSNDGTLICGTQEDGLWVL